MPVLIPILVVLVIAFICALLLTVASIFFKVDTVCVAGTSKYTAYDVQRASGIRNGENLLTIRKARISILVINCWSKFFSVISKI